MGINAEIVPWSSVVGQVVLLKDSDTGFAVAQLGVRIHADAAGEQDIKTCAGHVARHVSEAFTAQARLERVRLEVMAIADDLGKRGLLDLADDLRLAFSFKD
jgi:hypothetical protein